MQKDSTEINFDQIYDQLIEPAVTAAGLVCVRSDRVSRSGHIHKDMIERIIESDVVVVDITLLNPNVFYELGIRHTARRSGTVIIRLANNPIPFNISGLRVFQYSTSNEEELMAARNMIETNVKNSLAEKNVDSLVHTLFGADFAIQRIGRPIPRRYKIVYQHPELGKRRIGMVTGDICYVDFVDVWVNAENTRMEMGRMHDESLSACVRYLGARRDEKQTITHDTIADELRRKVGSTSLVEAGNISLRARAV